jgi:hypothetical protein
MLQDGKVMRFFDVFVVVVGLQSLDAITACAKF